MEEYLNPFTRYITGENVPCLSPQNLVFPRNGFLLLISRRKRFEYGLQIPFNIGTLPFYNLFLFTETPNLIPNSFVVFTHNICHFPPEILFFKYLPRRSVCLVKFNTLLNFRKCKPGVSYTFNSLYKLISFIYSSSSSNTWTGLDLLITC